ncbi:MAG: permease [Candidatus Krumholzibacteriia bacterium]
MTLRSEAKALAVAVGVFVAFYHLPVGNPRFDGAVHEALALTRWYAREHVLLCLVPAFFIAGGISVFVSQGAVMKYLGAGARKVTAYGVASVSGTVLAVCSCTVLPLFAGIYRMGAGIGPATAFLYAGPAINALAIILTARVLGVEIGVARAAGAVVFSIVIGLLMHAIFRRDARETGLAAAAMPAEDGGRPLSETTLTFAAMIAVLVFANWGGAAEGLWGRVHAVKWWLTAGAAAGLGAALVAWYGLVWWKPLVVAAATIGAAAVWPGDPVLVFTVATLVFSWAVATAKGELGEWFAASWGFAKLILPLLLFGVLVAGLLLGRPGQEGLIPSAWIAGAVGGNSPLANLFAAMSGAFMYFATLTEVPILEGLLGAGMGKGPALTLLLAGPAVSLPSILVLHTIMGGRRTAVFIALVVVLSALVGTIFGALA